MPRELSQLLLDEGVVGADDVERALARQREAGGALDTALLELGLVPEERLVGLLSRASDLPAAPLSIYDVVDARARRVFPSKVAERHGLAPFALDGRELSLVATHPLDLGLLDEISFMLSLHLTPHVGPEWRVRSLIQRLYGGALPPRLARLAEAAGAPAAVAAPAPPVPAPAPALASGEVHAAPPVPAPPRPPPRPGGFGGFTRDGDEPLEPLAAALAQAAEAFELDWEAEALAAPLPAAGEAAPESAVPAEAPARPFAEPAGPPPEEPPPGVEAAPAPREPDRTAPPRWSVAAARQALEGAASRDEIVLAALRYARDFFQYAALFAVTRDAVAGHDALGLEDGTRDVARTVALYVSDPGIFRTTLDTLAPYLGPVARDASGSAAVLDGLGRGSPRTALVYPILLRGRPICILYADNGQAPVSARRLGDLLLVLSQVGGAFERIIKARKGAGPAAAPRRRAGPPAERPRAAPAEGPAEPPDQARPAAPAAPTQVAPVEPPDEAPAGPAHAPPLAAPDQAPLQPAPEPAAAPPAAEEARAPAAEPPPAVEAAPAAPPADASPPPPSLAAAATGEEGLPPEVAAAFPEPPPLPPEPATPAAAPPTAASPAPAPPPSLDDVEEAFFSSPPGPLPEALVEPRPPPPQAPLPASPPMPAEVSVSLDLTLERPLAPAPPHEPEAMPAEVSVSLELTQDRPLAPPPAEPPPAEPAPPEHPPAAAPQAPPGLDAAFQPLPAVPGVEPSPPPAPASSTADITLEKPLRPPPPPLAPIDPAALVGTYLMSPRGSADRAFLLAKLVERAAEVAPVLCDQLPGPLDVPSEALLATPAPDQGPVLAAVAALGPAALKPLLALLADPVAPRRRAAVALLGQLGDAAAFVPLCERCFDHDPAVAEAARAALALHRRDPAIKPVPEKLRRALLSGLAEKAASAARAIAALRDAESIPLLIQALEGSDGGTAAASADALAAITLQRHGVKARDWLMWWKQNRGRSRTEWLFGALTSGDRDLRLLAASELREAAATPVTYSADLPEAERQAAAQAWQRWFQKGGHRL